MQTHNASPLVPSLLKAIHSVFAPGMFSVLFLSLVVTVITLLAFVFGTSALLIELFPHHWLAWAGSLAAVVVAWVLFPGIMPVIVSFFDNRVATLIEKQDYPDARPISPPFWPEFLHDVRFSLMAIGLNILALPLYFFPSSISSRFMRLMAFCSAKNFLSWSPSATSRWMKQRHYTPNITALFSSPVRRLPYSQLFPSSICSRLFGVLR